MLKIERWPVTYDADELKKQINALCSSEYFPKGFYYTQVGPSDTVQQGDLLCFNSPVPVIWEDAEPSVIDGIDYWLVVGNTCDFTRKLDDVPFTHIAPVISADVGGKTGVSRSDLQGYKYTRRFYIPPWCREVEDKAFLADFQRIVPIHKKAFELDRIERVASLSREGWILLHCCLIRFLCRDDGRFEP